MILERVKAFLMGQVTKEELEADIVAESAVVTEAQRLAELEKVKTETQATKYEEKEETERSARYVSLKRYTTERVKTC